MKNIMFGIALVLAFIFLHGVYNSNSIPQEMTPKSEGMPQVGNVFGAAVKSPKGENLGTIIDVVTGREGRAAFAILSYWISDDTQKRVAVPLAHCLAKSETVSSMSARMLWRPLLFLFRRITWLNRNWPRRSTGTSAYSPTGQSKVPINDGMGGMQAQERLQLAPVEPRKPKFSEAPKFRTKIRLTSEP